MTKIPIKLVSSKLIQYTSDSTASVLLLEHAIKYREKSKAYIDMNEVIETGDETVEERDLDFEHCFLKKDYNGYSIDKAGDVIALEIKFGLEVLMCAFTEEKECLSFVDVIEQWAML